MNRKIGYQEKESFAIEVEKDVIDPEVFSVE